MAQVLIHNDPSREPSVSTKNELLQYADLALNPLTHETRRGARHFTLTQKEFQLLKYLLRHAPNVLRREQLLQAVWGRDFQVDANVLEVYIGYLRKKTEAGGETRLIQTVRGVGYVVRQE